MDRALSDIICTMATLQKSIGSIVFEIFDRGGSGLKVQDGGLIVYEIKFKGGLGDEGKMWL